jgi:hypothetical protein
MFFPPQGQVCCVDKIVTLLARESLIHLRNLPRISQSVVRMFRGRIHRAYLQQGVRVQLTTLPFRIVKKRTTIVKNRNELVH